MRAVKEWLRIGDVVRHIAERKAGYIVSGCVGCYRVKWGDDSITDELQEDLMKITPEQIVVAIDAVLK